MFFNSFDFAIFLVIVLSLYFVLQGLQRPRLQNAMLLVASYVFYAAWDWRFTLLIAISTVVDYTVGLALADERFAARRVREL